MNIVSSNIRTADYDRKNRQLKITFINRPRWVYIYYNVPSRIWIEFVKSQSKGQYLKDIIEPLYTYKRLTV